MPIANQDEVKAILRDFETRLRSVIDRAWAEWKAMPRRGRFLFARTRLNIIFDSIARFALEEFDEDKEIYVIAKNQTVQFLFRDRVLARFKKGNAKGVGSNINTQTVLEFIDPQLSIPDLLPEVHRVEICYQPDDVGINLGEVAVVARNRTRRVWAYPLGRSGASASGTVIELPQRPPDKTPPKVTPRKPKKDDSAPSEG
jgi:hypothetical protein